jgi:DNA-binding LacI/PurR family transcriptional regulator
VPRPTIADVARRAGVSPAAVSFAINNRPGVGEETRARILKAAEELGWHPSASARALTKAQARAVGLVIARDLDELELDAFFVRFLGGIERALAPSDFALLLHVQPHSAEIDLDTYRRLAGAGRVDGFVLTDVRLDDARFALLERAGVPAVVAGHPVGDCPFPWVETQHAEGMAAAVEYLARAGHRRVGFLGADAALDYVAVRRRRWEEALRAHGLDPGPAEHGGADDPTGDRAAVRLLDAPDRPSAVVCTSDRLALALLAAARDRGVRVPQDLGVTGFDDSPLAALASPPVTSVRVDYAQFGEAAATTLLALVGGLEPPPFDPAPPRLCVRASTARA